MPFKCYVVVVGSSDSPLPRAMECAEFIRFWCVIKEWEFVGMISAIPLPRAVLRCFGPIGHEGMGKFSVRLEVGDPSGQRFETIDAMVDSGATYTVLPASLLERVDVDAHATGTSRLRMAAAVGRRHAGNTQPGY